MAAFAKHDSDNALIKHTDSGRSKFLKFNEKHLTMSEISRQGPFVISSNITYADIVLFQILDDEGLTRGEKSVLELEYPRLLQLMEAVPERPNMKKFLNSAAFLVRGTLLVETSLRKCCSSPGFIFSSAVETLRMS